MWTRIILREKTDGGQSEGILESSCVLEFADWNDLEEQCLLLASHLAGLTVIDYPLQLVILFSHNHNSSAEEALTEEQINNFVPLLALIQLLIGRCLTFNIVSNNEIFKHLFPEYTSSSPDLLCIGLGVNVELGETGRNSNYIKRVHQRIGLYRKDKDKQFAIRSSSADSIQRGVSKGGSIWRVERRILLYIRQKRLEPIRFASSIDDKGLLKHSSVIKITTGNVGITHQS